MITGIFTNNVPVTDTLTGEVCPELRHVLSNGLTLCIDCHQKNDSYGWSKYWHNKRKETKAAKRIDGELNKGRLFEPQELEQPRQTELAL